MAPAALTTASIGPGPSSAGPAVSGCPGLSGHGLRPAWCWHRCSWWVTCPRQARRWPRPAVAPSCTEVTRRQIMLPRRPTIGRACAMHARSGVFVSEKRISPIFIPFQ